MVRLEVLLLLLHQPVEPPLALLAALQMAAVAAQRERPTLDIFSCRKAQR